jgi:ribose 5-phosphate isomerase A
MNEKELVAHHAAQYVSDGMVLGLGTGSTANYLIRALARRAHHGLRVSVVASSLESALLAKELGLNLQSIEQVERLDLYIDGADEVSPEKALLKGRGYDLVKEKLLARSSERFLVLIDASKQVAHLGERFAIPVEVMPIAWYLVRRQLLSLGATAALRRNVANDAPAITSAGNLVLEVRFVEGHAALWNEQLNAISGVVEHGIFLNERHTVLLAHEGAVQAL